MPDTHWTSIDRHTQPPLDRFFDQPLPDHLDAEKYVLGAILTDPTAFLRVAGDLTADDFSLEKHKRLFLRMSELYEADEVIDRITVHNALVNHGQLQSVGFSYLVSLDEGMPQIVNLEGWVRIIRNKARLRRLALITQDLTAQCLAGDSDPDSIIASAEEALLGLGDSSKKTGLTSPRVIVDEYEGGLNAFLDTSQRVSGIATGFTRFDEMTGGLREGELIILAARPAMGKTSLAMNIAHNVSTGRNPKSVAVFSLEMSKELLLTRMVCSQSRVDVQRFRAGYLNRDERDSLQSALFGLIQDNRIHINDSAATNLMDVHSQCRRLQAEQDLGLVIVDYLQLMEGRGKNDNRQHEVSKLSRGFKVMSKELKVPFLVLSQLSRAPETRPGDHRPILSDLRESGSIEADADMVGFVFRQEVYRPDKEELKGLAELIIAKQRNGPIGRVKLAFLHRYTKFENLAEGVGGEDESPYE